MKTIRSMVAGLALTGIALLPATHALAEPTETISGGVTSVKLAADFLGALNSLGVAPGAIAPGKLFAKRRGVFAAFPITTGVVDLGVTRAEVGHKGALTLTAGGTRVELSAFIIDLAGDRPVLTGLAVVNDNLVARIPLFDLDLRAAQIKADDDDLKVSWVEVTLAAEAAAALNSIFEVDAFVEGFPIGIAKVRATLDADGEKYEYDDDEDDD